ncbi:uncharacterized protein LOC132276481 [Cornus florida]|uniref:uncharacterized protein LOC132276481 n=1 Tax=Cornus florida TaxID=4283 RepID=UPI0028A08DB5|nr:uncharacterized protein LOC132276481 [Cornus florida]
MDGLCKVCGMEIETLKHQLCDCQSAKLVWKGFSYRIDVSSVGGSTWGEWWMNLIHSWDGLKDNNILIGIAANLCWYLWKSRNDSVFGRAGWSGQKIIEVAVGQFWEFYGVHSKIIQDPYQFIPIPSPLPVRWLPPNVGCLRANVDAAVNTFSNEVAGGLKFLSDPTVGEAFVLRQTMLKVRKRLLSQVIFESNAKQMVDIVNGTQVCPIALMQLIEDVQMWLKHSNRFVVKFVPRDANIAVHNLAKYAKSRKVDAEFSDFFPLVLMDVVVEQCI